MQPLSSTWGLGLFRPAVAAGAPHASLRKIAVRASSQERPEFPPNRPSTSRCTSTSSRAPAGRQQVAVLRGQDVAPMMPFEGPTCRGLIDDARSECCWLMLVPSKFDAARASLLDDASMVHEPPQPKTSGSGNSGRHAER